MKDSGIPWIGEIPKDWGTDAIGSLYLLRHEKVSDKDYPPLSVTKNGIVPQLATAAKTDDGDNRKLVRKGDFAINSRSDRRGSCGVSAYDGSVSLINTILTPRGEMNPQFYNWFFHTEAFADEFYRWGHGIVDDLWTTGWAEMKRISVITPPLSEQQRIAEFLNMKCGEIDEAIALQEEFIEELKSYKQSVITEAVTRGLNPNVKFKDSGIDWIGKIPGKWGRIKLKYYISIKSGDAIETDLLSDQGQYPVYGGGELIGYTNKFNSSKDDLLIGRVGARCGCITMPLCESWATDNALILKTTFCLTYMYYLLIGCDLNRQNTSNAQPLITSTKIKNTDIPVPPLNEQHQIADYLDNKCTDIDNLIAIKQQKIEELKDYKKSIIYEYVTGKKKWNNHNTTD